MMMRFRTPKLAIVLVAICCMGGTASAATMTYPDMAGDTVVFLAPTESTNTANLLYQAPSVLVDTLYLVPDNFGLQVGPGAGAALLDSQIETTIMAKPGYTIEAVEYSEAGDYSAYNNGMVQVDLPYFWTVLEINNAPVTPITKQGMAAFVANGTSSGLWDLDFDVGVAGEKVTKMRVTFNNKLLATANDATSLAFIKKKQTGGIRVTTEVPEPNSIILLVMGVLGMVATRRR